MGKAIAKIKFQMSKKRIRAIETRKKTTKLQNNIHHCPPLLVNVDIALY